MFYYFQFALPTHRLVYSNKDVWMDLNQVYNLILIGWNNPKITQGGESCQVHTCNFQSSNKYCFYVNTLTYSLRFSFLLCLYNLSNLRSPISLVPTTATASMTLVHHHPHTMKPFISRFLSWNINHGNSLLRFAQINFIFMRWLVEW